MALIDDLRDLAELGPDFDDIIDQVKELNEKLAEGGRVSRDQITQVRKIARSYSDYYQQIEKVVDGNVKSSELVKKANVQLGISQQLTAKKLDLETKAARSSGNTKKNLLAQAQQLDKAAQSAAEQALAFEQLADYNDDINKKTGWLKGLTNIVSSIPGLEKMGATFGEISKEVRQAYVNTGDYEKALKKGFSAIGEIIRKLFIVQIFKANQEIVNLQRNLNLSKTEAMGARYEFAAMAAASGEIAVSSGRLIEANTELNNQLGTAVMFSEGILTEFTKLTKQIGLSSEAAGSLAQQAMISGESLEEVKKNALASSYSLQRASGVALNQTKILEATGKVTGMIRANLGANPALIAQAVTKATLLGTELETISRVGRTLLDFEQSIGAELEAELLTGKQLNLEKARAAALAGEELVLMEELGSQFGSYSEFMDMNVLQREKLAAAMGMEANAMADMLMKQEAQGRNAAELRALGKDVLADRVEELATQEKIANFTEKFQSLLADIAVILTPVVDFIGNIFSIFSSLPGQVVLFAASLKALIPLLGILKSKGIASAIANIFAGATRLLGPFGIPVAIAGVAALGMTIAQYAKADDAMYGDNKLETKNKGSIAFNNNDAILVAGTGLFKGRRQGENTSNNNNLDEDRFVSKLARMLNRKNRVVFDYYDSAGPLAMQNSDDRRENRLFG